MSHVGVVKHVADLHKRCQEQTHFLPSKRNMKGKGVTTIDSPAEITFTYARTR
jgi:hypothetical protein